jgi:hypothetical protein
MVLMIAGFVFLGMSGLVSAQEAQDAHQQAAEAFLLSMNTPEQLKEGITAMVDMMMQQNPMMEPYRQTITGFYQKYLSWEALRKEYIAVAKDLLTEAELKEITAFFGTPAGKTFIEKQPEMFQRTSEMGFRIMQDNQQELMDLLQAEAEKNMPAEEAAE